MTDNLSARSLKIRRAVDAFHRSSSAGGVRVTLNDDGPGDRTSVDRLFVGLGATLDAIPSALRAAVPVIRAAHARNFASESSGYGGWPGLAPRTIRQRERLGFGGAHPILVRTGALRSHVLAAPAVVRKFPGGAELRIAPSPTVSGVPKYRALARGYAPNNLPARPMVSLDAKGRTAVTSAISRFLRQRAAAMSA